MTQVDLVLDRLASYGLRPNGNDRWRACCPSHGGKNRSALSVGIGQEGQVLLRCWHGCDAEDVAGALGLDLSDLFPPRESTAALPQRRRMLTAGQALDLLADETNLAAVTALNLAQGIAITDVDRARLLVAGLRRRPRHWPSAWLAATARSTVVCLAPTALTTGLAAVADTGLPACTRPRWGAIWPGCCNSARPSTRSPDEPDDHHQQPRRRPCDCGPENYFQGKPPMTNVFFLRACATCAAYENSECMNGVGDGTPGGRCDDHLTHEEDRIQDQALHQLRVALDACHRTGATHLIQGLVEVSKLDQRVARRLSAGVA